MIIYILIHLIGAILGYFLRREQIKRMNESYTVSDRNLSISAHLTCSWVCIFATLMVYILEESGNNQKQAKW